MNMPAVMQRFMKENTFGTKTRTLAKFIDYKAKKRLVKTWHNPYPEKEAVREEKDRIKRESLFSYDKLWTGYEDRKTRMAIREDVLLRDGPTCATCGKISHPSEGQVDHIVARKRGFAPKVAPS